ncbi:hypothetical protein [Mesorhizobium sp. B2-3-15]|uniref:hypothetical protein n=1 Tax=Mesorhizobium sp. B2-3-15 TaxID=2589949 RepID=UPI0015E45067|nr:hypothetical protein [Mesorhizobium sp. B2-3-15]
MRIIALAGMLILSVPASQAQTTTPQPAAPTTETPAGQVVASRQGGPANLCHEILAFLKAPPPETPPPTGAAKKPEAASAKQGTTGSGDPAKSEGGTGSAQKITGQDGVATDAPEPGKDNAASGSANNAPQKESRAAPLPPADVTSTPKQSVLTVEAAEQLANANDIAQCQKTARAMRVAGVAMPPPLIALAALDMQYQQKAAMPVEPSGTAAGQPLAPQAPTPK